MVGDDTLEVLHLLVENLLQHLRVGRVEVLEQQFSPEARPLLPKVIDLGLLLSVDQFRSLQLLALYAEEWVLSAGIRIGEKDQQRAMVKGEMTSNQSA
jgi:hypothetical protein